MTIAYKLLTQGVSESVMGFVAEVNAFLTSVGPIGLQDVSVTRLEGLNKRGRLRLTLSYNTPGPLQMGTSYFGVTTGPLPSDAQAATFFAANPLYRALFIRDVGDELRGGLDALAIMVIYGQSPITNVGQGRARPMIVQALGNIAPGATGSAQLVSASGLVAGAVVTVLNRFDTTWATGALGYATARSGSGVLDGYKTCC